MSYPDHPADWTPREKLMVLVKALCDAGNGEARPRIIEHGGAIVDLETATLTRIADLVKHYRELELERLRHAPPAPLLFRLEDVPPEFRP